MKAEFIPNYPPEQLKPADYNPRHPDEEKFVLLQESLRKVGVIKPIIINGENGIYIELENAEEVKFSMADAAPNAPHYRSKNYHTCLNWQFAYKISKLL